MELNILTGITRKVIGATFEGETKDADGSVYEDVVLEGLSPEVCTSYVYPTNINGSDCLRCEVLAYLVRSREEDHVIIHSLLAMCRTHKACKQDRGTADSRKGRLLHHHLVPERGSGRSGRPPEVRRLLPPDHWPQGYTLQEDHRIDLLEVRALFSEMTMQYTYGSAGRR